MKRGLGISGMEDLVKDFKALSELDQKGIKKVLKNAAAPMIQTMKSRVLKKSGRLANSIGLIDPDNSKYPFTVLVGPDYRPDNRGTMTIAALAAVQEYGAAERVPRKGKNYKKVLIDGKWVTMSQKNGFNAIPARPFFRPAIDKHQEQVENDIAKGVEDIIFKAKTKIINK